MEDTGGGIWAIAIVLGTIVLAAVLAYGTMHYRRRGRGPTAPRSYDHPAGSPGDNPEIRRAGRDGT